MSFTIPTASDFKAQFFRDFDFAEETDQTNLKKVLDLDLTNAIVMAGINFNECLYSDDTATKVAFLFLAAFYLVENIKNSAKGMAAQSKFPITSKTAGGVSVQYQVPDRFLRDPFVALLASNGYGLMYLSMTLPAATGQIFVSPGGPKP